MRSRMSSRIRSKMRSRMRSIVRSKMKNRMRSRMRSSVQLSPGSKNESYPQQFEFQNLVNFAWISREFRVVFGE